MIKNILRRYKANNRHKPEHIERAINDANWLALNYCPSEIRIYMRTLDSKLLKLKTQRIIELESELIELKKT
jgi:hypothetical protein